MPSVTARSLGVIMWCLPGIAAVYDTGIGTASEGVIGTANEESKCTTSFQ